MNDTTKICITVGIVVASIVGGIVGGIWAINKQRIAAGLTRCYVLGSPYPQWVHESNCSR